MSQSKTENLTYGVRNYRQRLLITTDNRPVILHIHCGERRPVAAYNWTCIQTNIKNSWYEPRRDQWTGCVLYNTLQIGTEGSLSCGAVAGIIGGILGIAVISLVILGVVQYQRLREEMKRPRYLFFSWFSWKFRNIQWTQFLYILGSFKVKHWPQADLRLIDCARVQFVEVGLWQWSDAIIGFRWSHNYCFNHN